MRAALLIGALVIMAACGGSPSAPTPSAPATAILTLTGTVASTAGTPIAGATARIIDGPFAGRTSVTNNAGAYAFGSLAPAGFTVDFSAQDYLPTSRSVNLTSDQTIDVRLEPRPLFTRSGVGDFVFDMPTTVRRVRIQGSTNNRCQNFIVHIAGRSVVNVIIGTCSIADSVAHDGTYVTTGGVTEILSSSGVAWIFTEVRP